MPTDNAELTPFLFQIHSNPLPSEVIYMTPDIQNLKYFKINFKGLISTSISLLLLLLNTANIFPVTFYLFYFFSHSYLCSLEINSSASTKFLSESCSTGTYKAIPKLHCILLQLEYMLWTLYQMQMQNSQTYVSFVVFRSPITLEFQGEISCILSIHSGFIQGSYSFLTFIYTYICI